MASNMSAYAAGYIKHNGSKRNNIDSRNGGIFGECHVFVMPYNSSMMIACCQFNAEMKTSQVRLRRSASELKL